ncbi:MAG TPA: hypothetical protein VER58_12365 [Thermoanaerobaculia bacterium]|nr:hypothetical protein [Thermoanaerobaculia bacterium]
MRKLLVTVAASFLLSTQAFAAYFIVLKDGTQYKARQKWTVVGGKATFQLENGQTLQLDPASIDVAKSEEATKYGGGSVLGQEQLQPTGGTKPAQSNLGGAFKLRKLPTEQPAVTNPNAPPPVAPISGIPLSSDVIAKFERAYENVGIFEHKLTPTGAHTFRAELVTDNEEKVFNALSATAFLMMHEAGVPGTKIDMAELFMQTTIGVAAGRFQMTHADAETLDSKKMTREEYFIRKVVF